MRPLGKRAAAWALVLALCLCVSTAAAQEWDTLRRRQGEFVGEEERIRTEQQQILADLFAMNRTLQQLETELDRLHQEIDQSGRRLRDLAAEGSQLRQQYQARLRRFGARLRLMYERGVVSYLEVILDAADFRDFLERVDLLQLILRRDLALLTEVRQLRLAVAEQEERARAEWQALTRLRDRQAAKRQELAGAIAAKEARLGALKERRGEIEAALGRLEQVWTQSAIPVLEAFGTGFHSLSLQLTELQPDAVQFETFPPGATIVVSEAALNGFVSRLPEFAGLRFRLTPGQADVVGEFGGAELEVLGGFRIAGPGVLRYTPSEIRFFGVSLPPELGQELLGNGRLDVDLSEIIHPGQLEKVMVEQGRLVVRVIPA